MLGRRRHSAGNLLAVDWSTVCDTMSGRETQNTCLQLVNRYQFSLSMVDVMSLHGVGSGEAIGSWKC